MTVQFVISFRDDNDSEGGCKLLLYHEISGKALSANDKEQKMGMIKGIWKFSNEFSENKEYCHLELDSYQMVVIQAEPSYYVCLGFQNPNSNEWSKYRVRLSQCYQYFMMQHGFMSSLEDKRLVQLLNEHFIPFWDEISLIPDYFAKQDINSSIDENIFPCCQFKGALESISEVKEWESYLKSNVLLSQENFTHIKDICVYNLPKYNKDANKYGFVTNFDSNFKSLSTFSNWLISIDSTYGTISSHGLAGTMSLAETDQQIELDAGESESEPSNLRNIWGNVTLPISFTLDAIKDIGQLTGVSNSLSMFTNLKPWNPFASQSESKGTKKKDDKNDYSWLISPLNPDFLPKVYQIRSLYLQFDVWKQYNVLFWKFRAIVIAVIIEPEFDMIWQEEYLLKLQENLCNGMSLFYDSTGFEDRNFSFDYTIVYKDECKYYSSIPIWKNGLEEDETPLRLVIKGLDETLQFLTNNANRKSSIATASEIRRNGAVDERQMSANTEEVHEPKVKDSSIFGKLNETQLIELNKELMVILENRKLTVSHDRGIDERLLKLNNGLMVYVYEDKLKLAFIIKNWFDESPSLSAKKSTDMVESLGVDAAKWWNNIKDHEPT